MKKIKKTRTHTQPAAHRVSSYIKQFLSISLKHCGFLKPCENQRCNRQMYIKKHQNRLLITLYPITPLLSKLKLVRQSFSYLCSFLLIKQKICNYISKRLTGSNVNCTGVKQLSQFLFTFYCCVRSKTLTLLKDSALTFSDGKRFKDIKKSTL